MNKPVNKHLHRLCGKNRERKAIQFSFGQKIKQLQTDSHFQFFVPDSDVDELHIKDINDIGFAFTDFDLFDEGLQENIDRNGWVLLEYPLNVSQHEFPHC